MRKILSLLPVLLLILNFSAAAEKNYTSDKVIFLPQDFYVGDLVEMRVVIKPDSGVFVAKPEKFPESYWVKIEDAEVLPAGEAFELRVFLRSYAPGIRTLPALQFGDVLLRDIRIQTKSVLAEEALPLSPPAGQFLLPGTKYYIALLVGILFLLPIFFIFFWTKLKAGFHSYILDRKQRRPYKRLMKAIRELESGLNETKGKYFYTTLIYELRIYLTARGSIDYTSATASEGSARIVSDFKTVSGCDRLIRILKLADEVKFGSRRVMIRKREEDLHTVIEIVTQIEAEAAGGVKNVDL